jgi:GT2 family glycosyltransferase
MPQRRRSIRRSIRQGVTASAGHPAVLGYVIGNEIPAAIVRWHGQRRIERFLESLHATVKDEDPDALVTYANYPSTEYLDLQFLDFLCFNVFLEDEEAFETYLARLQNVAGDHPLVVTESGLDSRRNGDERQAEVLRWQIRHSFATGAAGVFVFSWTDEWHRGGDEITDWDFGVVDRERRPKPSLSAIRDAFAEAPFPRHRDWPRISVVVCTHNGERTIRQCLERLTSLRYPQYEVIVVSDGCTDATDAIAQSIPACTLVRTKHAGLGAARNAGIRHASGEIVAFLDDDAYPDFDWLHYLGATFAESSHAAVGGPNIPPHDDRLVASCVARAPGGPVHVLITDREAEHIPGCNMAFRREALEAVGGFDPRFRVAGDDVDVCWRLQATGHTVGFCAGAVVFHHRRDSLRGYVRQQYEYGKAEGLLARKWPGRYKRGGYLDWTGRIYGRGSNLELRRRRRRINYGQWGSGLFQFVYQPAPGLISSLPLMPQPYVVLMALTVAAMLGFLWAPMFLALPVVAAGGALILATALLNEGASSAAARGRSRLDRAERRVLTALLTVAQPLARLLGRLRVGLLRWRGRSRQRVEIPKVRTFTIWSERWRAPDARLLAFEQGLIEAGAAVLRGTAFDRWDLEAKVGLFGTARVRSVVEEHGSGRQLMRLKVWPRIPPVAIFALPLLGLLAAAAALDTAWEVAALLAALGVAGASAATHDAAAAMGIVAEIAEREQARALMAAHPSANSNGSVSDGRTPRRSLTRSARGTS